MKKAMVFALIIFVALDGSTDMRYRVTGMFAAILTGNLPCNPMGVRWLKKTLSPAKSILSGLFRIMMHVSPQEKMIKETK